MADQVADHVETAKNVALISSVLFVVRLAGPDRLAPAPKEPIACDADGEHTSMGGGGGNQLNVCVAPAAISRPEERGCDTDARPDGQIGGEACASI